MYVDPRRLRLFDDTLPTLDRLTVLEWTHIMLSDHVLELREILDHLRLASRFARVFNSAETGYEKPHPQAFHMVLEAFVHHAMVWMMGDNPRTGIAMTLIGIQDPG